MDPSENDELHQQLIEEFWRKQVGKENTQDDDQSVQAIRNLAVQCVTMFNTFLQEGVDVEVALALTQTYLETIVHTMLRK